MYNRYIPNDAQYRPVSETRRGSSTAQSPKNTQRPPPPPRNGENPLNGIVGGLSGLLNRFHLERLDRGDILLVLILIFLFLEQDDNLDLVITLGLLLVFGLLGDDETAEHHDPSSPTA